MLIKHYLIPLIKRQKVLFCCMAFMSALTFSYFVSSTYALENYKISIGNFFNETNYPTAFINTEPTNEASFDCLKSIDGVKDYDVRFSSLFNFKVNDAYNNALLHTYKDDDFSKFAYFGDYVDSSKPGIFIEKQFADVQNLKAGDTVSLGKNGIFCDFTINQIITKPENLHFYALGNIGTDNISYGVIYINHKDLNYLLNSLNIPNFGIDSNEVFIDIDASYEKHKVLDDCYNELLNNVEVLANYLDEDSPSAQLRDELTMQFTGLSETVPFAHLVIMSLIFILFLIQIIKKQSREIGIMLAYGNRKVSIYLLFAAFTFLISFVSIIVGLIMSCFLGPLVYSLYQGNINLPDWSTNIFIGRTLLNAFVVILVGQIACLICALTFKNSSPMDALEKSYQQHRNLGRIVEIVLYRLPTAIRLALSSIVLNLRNFIVVVLGFIASFVIIYSAFSVYFSMQEYINYTYDEQNNYDAQVVSYQNRTEESLNELKECDCITKLQIYDGFSDSVRYGDRIIDTTIIEFPPDNNMLNFKDAYTGEPVQIPNEGIILDKLSADRLNAKPGSYVEILNKKLKVESIVAMYSEQYQIVSASQMQEFKKNKNTYALVNTSSKEKLEEFCAFSKNQLCPIFTSNFKQMEVNFKTSFTMIVDIAVLMAIILGFIVVVTVSKMIMDKQKRTISILRCQGMHLLAVSNY